ncbi:MAG: CBS domain-containing protein [Candidatus Thorarchaeota archaeon]
MQVESIMAKPVRTIDKDQAVSSALETMEKLGISAIPVTEDNRLIGLITEVDIVDRLGSSRAGRLTPASIHVSSVMELNPKTVEPSTDIFEAARLLINRQERALPVVKDNEVLGIITNTHFVKQCLDIDKLQVRDLRLEKPISLGPRDRVVHARQLILSESLPGIPVFDQGKIIGLVTKKRLALGYAAFRREVPAKYQSTRLRDFLVENIFISSELSTSLNATIAEAAELLLREHQHVLPVMKKEIMQHLLIRRNLVELVANRFKPPRDESR